MRTVETAAEYVPDSRSLRTLRSAAAECQGCALHRDATQTVFGEGPRQARAMLVGEQPGDREDVEGAPFVGPAGRLLDRALGDSGIDRDQVYLTNAVKHFKFVPAERGKRRIHRKPSRTEVVACRPWLLAEIDAVRPELLVLLGATAAQAVLGASFRLTRHRGEILELPGEFGGARGLATVHPSAVLRTPDRDEAYAAFADDLKVAARNL